MEKSKRILIMLAILLIMIVVVTILLINTNKKQEVHQNNTQTSTDASNQDESFGKVKDYKTYFTVKEIVENYITYMKQINGDEYVDASKLQMTSAQIAEAMRKTNIRAFLQRAFTVGRPVEGAVYQRYAAARIERPLRIKHLIFNRFHNASPFKRIFSGVPPRFTGAHAAVDPMC